MTLATPRGSKERTMFAISTSAFIMEARFGHLKWKVTDLVRSAGISRPLIYRYYGSTKEQILLSAVEYFCTEFYGLTTLEYENGFFEGISEARKIVGKCPEAIMFYQKWRNRKSLFSEKFIEVENRFREKLQRAFPNLSDDLILALHTEIHGIVTAPFLTAEQEKKIGRLLLEKEIFESSDPSIAKATR